MIKTRYIALLFCFFSNYATGQLSIDAIKSDSDAVEFVQQYGDKYKKGWKDVGVDLDKVNSVKNLKAYERRFTDSVTKRKWIRQDFNGDGKNDLIFCGRVHYNQLGVLAFITEGKDSIGCIHLGTIFSMQYPNTILERVIDGYNILELGQFYKKNEAVSDYKSAYEKDLLVYKYGGFIEYNNRGIKKIEFDSIKFRVSSPWVNYFSPSKLNLYKEGSIKVFQKMYQNNDSDILANRNKINIEISAIEEINNLLGYIKLNKLKSNYFLTNVSDLSTAYIEIYHKGKIKRIEDYGMSGTYGLVLLYSKLWAIMQGENKAFKKE